jgi:oligopeptide/dipeptide ABC transporter ATP-binding protein
MDQLLVVEDLVKHYPIRSGQLRKITGYVRAVDGVSFSIERGKTLGLVGESGSGKTTLGRAILRLVEPTSGRILFEGRDLMGLSQGELRRLRRHIQMIFQDPYDSLNPRMTIGSMLEEPMLAHRIASNKDDARQRAAELLRLVGLEPDHLNRYPHEFSGGQRQRIGIARALTTNPKFIVCDEPISALDVSVQAQILNLLVELQGQLSLTYLFIAHDLGAIRHISDRVAVMYLGKIVEEADSAQLLNMPLHPYTQQLVLSMPIPRPGARRERAHLLRGEAPEPTQLPSGCRFHPRCPLAVDACKLAEPPLLELRPGHRVACIRAESLPGIKAG